MILERVYYPNRKIRALRSFYGQQLSCSRYEMLRCGRVCLFVCVDRSSTRLDGLMRVQVGWKHITKFRRCRDSRKLLLERDRGINGKSFTVEVFGVVVEVFVGRWWKITIARRKETRKDLDTEDNENINSVVKQRMKEIVVAKRN